ncbi:MAG TPA: MOSC N-terminal beta barrel domain-containing protein, partial [Micromonospora sp.]
MRLASIHTYPVKGCHRVDQDSAAVEPWGLAGDRRWMLVDPDGIGVTQRDTPRLVRLRARVGDGGLTLRAEGRADLVVKEPTDGPVLPDVRVFRHKVPVPARIADEAAAEWLGELVGRPVRLVWLGDPTVRAVDTRWAAPGDRVSFADGYPVLLANAASLDALNDWLAGEGSAEGPLPVHRFRPN